MSKKDKILDLIDDIDDLERSIKNTKRKTRKKKLKAKLQKKRNQLKKLTKKVKLPTIKPTFVNFDLTRKIRKSRSRLVRSVVGNPKQLNDTLKFLKTKGGKFRIQALSGGKAILSIDVKFPGDDIKTIKWAFLKDSATFIFKDLDAPVIRVTSIKRVKSKPLKQIKFKNSQNVNCS